MMIDWQDFEAGMAAARQVPDVARQATSREARSAGGPDFLGKGSGNASRAWHQGFDHAVHLARRNGEE
ncbi:MAG: hypothetical protein BGP11_05435 [Rhodobacterales bacterium 65-51]|uniref:hypothetical protein n=1 Tax=uncultured Gemmobacter sp. TaxID=1095917 RepID=UPI00095C08A4|nr:hypothetical protein [uncultured Gemmobacter sp.]OJY33165.1 MAG: hypothetical protein BGP11_05435 [Rhodobacterales bacterium 65-51]